MELKGGETEAKGKGQGLVAKLRAPFQPDFCYDHLLNAKAKNELLLTRRSYTGSSASAAAVGSSSGILVPIPPSNRSAAALAASSSSRCNPFVLLARRQETSLAELLQHEHDTWVGISATMRNLISQRHFQPLIDHLEKTDEKQSRCSVALQEKEERAFLSRRAADLAQLVEVQRKLEAQAQDSSLVDDTASDATGANEETKQAAEAALGVGFLSVLLIPLRQHETKSRSHLEKAQAIDRERILSGWADSYADAASREHVRKHRERCLNYREERRQALIQHLLLCREALPTFIEEAEAREAVERAVIDQQKDAALQLLTSVRKVAAVQASFRALQREQAEWHRMILQLEMEAALEAYASKETCFRTSEIEDKWERWFGASTAEFHKQSEHIQTLLQRKIEAARKVQRFFRRRKLGCAGWRATHRKIGAWIGLHRETLRREAAKKERLQYLNRLRNAIETE